MLLVGNHSGGILIVDTFVFAQAFYEQFGADREFYQLAHDLVFKVPGVRALVTPYGTVPASPANLRRALGPDGDPEAGYDLVTGLMQRALDELARARAFPLIG